MTGRWHKWTKNFSLTLSKEFLSFLQAVENLNKVQYENTIFLSNEPMQLKSGNKDLEIGYKLSNQEERNQTNMRVNEHKK